MARTRRNGRTPPPTYRVGDVVSFTIGRTWVTGRVVEDRGGLGIGGRRLYGIKFDVNPGEERYIELPEVELTAGAAAR